MRVVAILQARMHSTRLAGKMLLPLLNKPLVQHVIERTLRATKLDDVVLAVPSRDAADFAPICNGRAWLYAYAGEEADLVSRYVGAATAHDADLIVRIPCDNPCIDPEYIDSAIDYYKGSAQVFYSNTTGLHWETALDGIGCEVFSISRLKWLDQRTHGMPDYREHLHKWFQAHRDYDLPNATIRLDVNTQGDYEFIKDIYDHFQRNDFTAAEIVAYLESKKVPA